MVEEVPVCISCGLTFAQFAIPEEPVARIGPEECAAVQESALQEIKALGDDLEHIKAVHSEYKKAYKRLQASSTIFSLPPPLMSSSLSLHHLVRACRHVFLLILLHASGYHDPANKQL